MHLTDSVVGLLPTLITEETRPAAVNSNGASKMTLIHEALSRVRMRRPQADYTPSTEAHRPALQIAMRARQRADREQGIN